jgi:AcrR family transcriptional regulator
LRFASEEKSCLDAPVPAREPKSMPRKESLLRAAERVFGEKGFDGASIRDIADAGGVKIGSIYNFFSDKHALHSAVLERAYARLQEYVEAAELTDDPAANLRRVLGAVARFFDEHPMAHRMIAHEMMHFPGENERAIRLLSKTRSLIMDIINDGKRKGIFRDVDQRTFSFGLINATFGFFIVRPLFGKLIPGTGREDEKFAANLPFPLFETLMAGLTASDRPNGN